MLRAPHCGEYIDLRRRRFCSRLAESQNLVALDAVVESDLREVRAHTRLRPSNIWQYTCLPRARVSWQVDRRNPIAPMRIPMPRESWKWGPKFLPVIRSFRS